MMSRFGGARNSAEPEVVGEAAAFAFTSRL